MASNNLEDLLQDALGDFGDALAPTTPAVAPVSRPEPAAAPSASTQADAATSTSDPPAPAAAPAAPAKAAPKGLGLGLGGADPLGRRPRKPEPALKAAAPEESPSAPTSSSRSKAPPKLNADAQRLADDLLGLLQEAGVGEEQPADPAAALAALMAGSGAAGPSDAGAEGETDDPFAKLFGSMLGGLMPPGAAAAGAGGAGGSADGPPPEFAALMQQMMMAGAGAGPGPGPAAAGADPMQALAAALAGGGGTAAAAGPSSSAAGGAAADNDDDALASSRLAGLAKQTKKTVAKQAKKTRGHMEGGAARPGGAAGAGGGGPFGLGSLLAELGGAGGLGGEGGGEGGGVNMMVDYIMRHLLSKDVLYGPLKEIRDRYPPWLESHQGSLAPEDYQRYVAQYESVQRVCAHYEAAPGDFAKLMDLIQEMQTYGDPPGDIVEEMTGGAGRDINSILNAAESEQSAASGSTAQQPALDEISSELDKCKVQ